MSLWGCDCPLPALAAYHWRGMVCRRLSLFSPLFCARAWLCLRLGLAFRVVDIAQSGLLAQIISLRQRLGYSGQFLAMQPTPCLPAQSPLVNGGCRRLRCFSSWGSYRRARNVRLLIVYLFFLPVMLPSVLPRLGTDSAVRKFPGVWKLLSFKTPFSGWNSVPPSFVSFFVFYIFSYLLSKTWVAFLGA